MNKSDLLPAKPKFELVASELLASTKVLTKGEFDIWFESVFADAVEVYVNRFGDPDLKNLNHDDRMSLMLKPVPITRGVTKQEILADLLACNPESTLAKRIEQEGIAHE